MEDIDADGASWMEYISFILMLTVSAVIGIYFGIFRKKQNTVDEYMFGGRKMHSIPVCLSIVASCVSNISLVVWPLETYYYGGTIFFMAFGDLTASVLIYFFYLPVFYHLEYTSLFEYLERRFNRICRKIFSIVYVQTQIFYMMVIMYTSCKAITQVIMIPYYIFTPSICLICTVYTCLGGIRGIIWTDFIQSLFMFVSVILIIILGTQTFDNGIADVFAISSKGGRLDIFSFGLNPFVRDSAWIEYLSVMVLSILIAGTNPGVMQRYLSLPSFSKAKMVLIIYAIINFLIILMSLFFGLLIYAYYHDCDPSMSQALSDRNQLVTYYISDVLKDVPGLTGLFLAGILSAALSSMSTIMNACSGIIFEDLVKPVLPWELTNAQNSLGIKCIVVAFGIIITFGIFCLNAEGGIFQVGRTIISLTCGTIVFIFSFGVFFRKGSTKGVIAGALAGLVLTLWIGIGSQAAVSSGRIRYSTKILSVEGCPGNVTEKLGLNATISGSSDYNAPVIFADDVPYLYRISFNLIAPMGIIVSIAVAFLVSLITSNDRVVEEKLLIPQIRKNHRNRTPNCDYVQCEEMILTNTE